MATGGWLLSAFLSLVFFGGGGGFGVERFVFFVFFLLLLLIFFFLFGKGNIGHAEDFLVQFQFGGFFIFLFSFFFFLRWREFKDVPFSWYSPQAQWYNPER